MEDRNVEENGSIKLESSHREESKPKEATPIPQTEVTEIASKQELTERKKEIEATSDREIKGVIELLACISDQEVDREETPPLDVSLAKTGKIIEEMQATEEPSVERTHRLLLVSGERLSYLNTNIETLEEQSDITWNQLKGLRMETTWRERRSERLSEGVFRKLRNLVERRRLNGELQVLNQQQEEVSKGLSALQEEINKAREKAEELQRLREEVFLGTVERVILGVRERHLSFTSELMEDEELTGRMNEELVRRKYLPELAKRGVEEEIIQKAEEIVLAQLNEKSPQGEEDSKQRWNRAIEREYKFTKLTEETINYLHFPTELGVGSESIRERLPNKGYERIFDLLARAEVTNHLREFSSAINFSSLPETLKEKALQSISRVVTPVDYEGKPYHPVQYHPVYKRFTGIHPERIPLDIEVMDEDQLELMLNLVEQRWEIVKKNPVIDYLFKSETWHHLEERIAKATLESLLVSRVQIGLSEVLGRRLFWLAEQNSELRLELAPYIILNSWREPGSSGEMPFLRENFEGRSMIYDFVESLSDEQLEKLRQEDMPGLLNLVRLIKENPNVLRASALESKKTYQEFQDSLTEATLALLGGEDKNKQIFAIDLLGNLRGNLSEKYDIFNKVFIETREERLRWGISRLWQNRKDVFINDALDQPEFDRSVFLFLNLRDLDPLLKGIPEEQRLQTDEAILHRFHEAIERISSRGDRDFFSNETVLSFLARQPERIDEVLSLFERNKELFKLLGPGGPLHANESLVINDIFSNGDFIRRAHEIESIFSKKVPFWRQLYLFTSVRLGDQLAVAISGYPLTEIAGIPLTNLVKRHQEIKSKDQNALTRLETIIQNDEIVGQLVDEEISSVPFRELTGGYKRLVFRDFLRKSVENSRDEDLRRETDERNRNLATDKLIVLPGTYIHGSPVDVIDSVLLNGNLPRESLGEGAATDGFPFQTDFACLTDSFIKEQENVEAIFGHSLAGGYGLGGVFGPEGQIFYVYRRGEDSYEQGKFYGSGEEHALILGGMPATEISGIVLKEPETTLEIVKKSILENGFYIPVYDLKGNLLLTPSEYDEIRGDLNLSIPVEIWDFSLKTGEQLGSNPGAEFTVPTNEGPKKFYTKFALGDSERINHIWCEQLADNIYRFMGISVPNTKIVKVEGTYGHASELLPQIEGKERLFVSLKDGFLIDALLANWDIPYAPERNTIEVDRVDYRIDNGGALLFHATGDRRGSRPDDLPFGEEVTETKLGSDKKRLGLGMRQEYKGLTDEEIRRQATVLREKLTDKAIDELVDSVRLSRKDRDYLKRVLRKRRDNIIKAVGI